MAEEEARLRDFVTGVRHARLRHYVQSRRPRIFLLASVCACSARPSCFRRHHCIFRRDPYGRRPIRRHARRPGFGKHYACRGSRRIRSDSFTAAPSGDRCALRRSGRCRRLSCRSGLRHWRDVPRLARSLFADRRGYGWRNRLDECRSLQFARSWARFRGPVISSSREANDGAIALSPCVVIWTMSDNEYHSRIRGGRQLSA